MMNPMQSSLNHSEDQAVLQSTIGNQSSKKDLWLQYAGNWVWRSVSALLDTQECPSSAAAIAERLSAPLAEVISALEGLQTLGLVQFNGQRYQKLGDLVVLMDRDLDPQAILADHVLISTQMLGRLRPRDENQKSFYRTSFLASNTVLVKEYCQELDQALRRLIQKSESCQPDQVYGLSVSLMSISKKNKPKVNTEETLQ